MNLRVYLKCDVRAGARALSECSFAENLTEIGFSFFFFFPAGEDEGVCGVCAIMRQD